MSNNANNIGFTVKKTLKTSSNRALANNNFISSVFIENKLTSSFYSILFVKALLLPPLNHTLL